MEPRPVPRRQSLVTQTIAYLNAGIDGGQWTGWLPSERALSETLLVSRNTLRAALAQLVREGAVEPVHGSGNRIVAGGPRRTSLKSRDVALLTPEPIEHLRPTDALWINELRALLNERGCRLHEFNGRQYFAASPAGPLRKLIRQNPHGCWVLSLSSEPLQRWFEKSRVPSLVAGTCYPGVGLPWVDLDYRAMCRHAAGVLLGLGHRRIALLNRRVRRGGDLESEEGFLEGIRASAHGDAEPLIVRHDPSVERVAHALDRLMQQQRRPTALLVPNPYFYLTVTSRLAQLGWRIPRDISVLSRDEDPFLSFLLPMPSRYAVPAHAYARSLLRPVLALLEGGGVGRRANRIMPDFIRGESIGAPPGA